ncbi:hypothetical protein ALQ79_200253 [Pseudomonas amygdali pv. lachrymans]|nr:hypothetical protein ALQ79_200253 [Pseudomonas amygdali pv. lachrymans]
MKVLLWAALSAALMAASVTVSASEPDDHRPPPKLPPEVAYQACDGLQPGDTVEFSQEGGHEFSGICQLIQGRLVAMPEHPQGRPGDKGAATPRPNATRG